MSNFILGGNEHPCAAIQVPVKQHININKREKQQAKSVEIHAMQENPKSQTAGVKGKVMGLSTPEIVLSFINCKYGSKYNSFFPASPMGPRILGFSNSPVQGRLF